MKQVLSWSSFYGLATLSAFAEEVEKTADNGFPWWAWVIAGVAVALILFWILSKLDPKTRQGVLETVDDAADVVIITTLLDDD